MKKETKKEVKVLHAKAPVYRGYGGALANRFNVGGGRQPVRVERQSSPPPQSPYGQLHYRKVRRF